MVQGSRLQICRVGVQNQCRGFESYHPCQIITCNKHEYIRRSVLAKFSKNNFKLIVREIEKMQAADENIDVPIGILEVMYEDY